MSISANDYASGNHKISVTAEDLSGNIGQKDCNVFVSDSEFIAPQVTFLQPVVDENLWGSSLVTGNFSSANPVNSILLFLDEYFIGEAEMSGNMFFRQISWSDYKEGDHVLKAVLSDGKGYLMAATRHIDVGTSGQISIESPTKDSYFQSEKIIFAYNSNGENITAVLDGKAIENFSEKPGYELGLGEHIFVIEKNGQKVVEKRFKITTSLADIKEVINLLFIDKHISDLQSMLGLQFQFEFVENVKRNYIESKFIFSALSSRLTLLDIRKRQGKIDGTTYLILKESIRFVINLI
jgi:hypothetical protein